MNLDFGRVTDDDQSIVRRYFTNFTEGEGDKFRYIYQTRKGVDSRRAVFLILTY